MKKRVALVVVVAWVLTLPALAQRPEEEHGSGAPRGGEMQRPAAPEHNAPRANQGHVPAAPAKRPPTAMPEVERKAPGRMNNTPHVANDHWYGHDRPMDPRYRQAHPFEHGHFEHVGPSFRYNVVRIDLNLHRFWLPGGFFFDVPAWEWPLAADWCWSCGEDFVIYEDSDHAGWYLLYNIHTGAFIHVMYMGM
jgi:hypothetical protein